MPVVVVATMTVKPESVDTVRDILTARGRRGARRARLPAVLAAPIRRDLRLRRAVGRRRGAQDPQHRARDRQDVQRGRRAPGRGAGHQDAAAGPRGRPGQGTAAPVTKPATGRKSRLHHRSRARPGPRARGSAGRRRRERDRGRPVRADRQRAAIPWPPPTTWRPPSSSSRTPAPASWPNRAMCAIAHRCRPRCRRASTSSAGSTSWSPTPVSPPCNPATTAGATSSTSTSPASTTPSRSRYRPWSGRAPADRSC